MDEDKERGITIKPEKKVSVVLLEDDLLVRENLIRHLESHAREIEIIDDGVYLQKPLWMIQQQNKKFKRGKC